MPLPIIADVFQVVMNWHYSGAPRDAATTMHFYDTGGGHTPTQLYTALDAAVTVNMWNIVGGGGIDKVRITPLDGHTAGQVFATGSPAKWSGSTASTDVILQGAQVISFRSTQRGPRGRNRIFLPWVAEGKQTSGTIDSGSLAPAATAWATFMTAIGTAGYPVACASAVHADYHIATSVTLPSSVYTQRRRARR